MKANDPFRKNVRFGIGVFFTVLEGTSFSLCLYGNLFAFEHAPKQYCHNRTSE